MTEADSPLITAVCPACRKTNRLPVSRTRENPDCGACGKPLFPGTPVSLTDQDFDAYVQRNGLPVVVDFWASWCGPCQMMAPHFAKAAGQLAGQFQFVKVDTEASPGLSQRFGIRSIPTLAVFVDGKETQRMSGAMNQAQLIGWLRSANVG